jgi:hypothetical protein
MIPMNEHGSFRTKKQKKAHKHRVRHSFLNIPVLHGEEGTEALEDADLEGKRPKSISRAILRSAFIVFSFVFGGWCFFGYKYGWTFIDCFYFAMVSKCSN